MKTYKLYKSVNKDLSSKYDKNFKYKVGKVFEIKDYDKSKELCSIGLHCSSIINANGYEWNNEQKILQVEVNEKDIIVKEKEKLRCKKLKVIKILTEKEIDKQIEKEFYKKFKVKGLYDYCKEFKNKKWLDKKFNNKDKKEITKLLINTNEKLRKCNWNYKDKVRFINLDSLEYNLGNSLWYSLWYSLGDSLGDSLWYSLWYSLGDSLGDSLEYNLGNSLRDSLSCKLSKKYKNNLLDDLIKVFRMGYLVAGKDKDGNWLVIVSKDKNFKEK